MPSHITFIAGKTLVPLSQGCSIEHDQERARPPTIHSGRDRGSRLLMRTSTCTRRTSSARELGRGACDHASTGSSVHRYYDPVTAQFTSVDPLVQSTGQPYSYAGGDPVNGVDPTGMISCPSWVPGCGTITDVQNVLSNHGSWRAEADYLAGVANGLTLDVFSIAEPYCGSIPWPYGLGTGIGVATSIVGSAAAADALGAGDIAYRSRSFGPGSSLFGNDSIGDDTQGWLNQWRSPLRLGWSVAPSNDGYSPVFRIRVPFDLKLDLLHTSGF